MTMRKVLLLAMLLCAPVRAMAGDAVSLHLDWPLYGFHVPFLVGVQNGLFRFNGIDLTIHDGTSAADAVQAVASETDQFGVAEGSGIIVGAAKGANIRAIMGLMNQNALTVILRPDSGVKTLQGLVGHSIAVTPGEPALELFPVLLKINNVPIDKLQLPPKDAGEKTAAFLAGKVHGMIGALDNQAAALSARGEKIVTLPYARYGVATMGLAVFTSNALLQGNPDLVRRFVLATRASYEMAMLNPEASVKTAQILRPGLDYDVALAQLKAGIALMRSRASAGTTLGFMAPGDWDALLELMAREGAVKTSLPARTFWTNEFIPVE